MLPKQIGRIVVPPIKCQGIKSKLIPFLAQSVSWAGRGRWLEPFLGSGVVLFNVAPERALAADSNPHLVRFYAALQAGAIDEHGARDYLEAAGRQLARAGADYYYQVRAQFNATHDPLAFLFLNRCCFNGLLRFNRRGEFNVPFCRKPQRFRPAYVTKICNQVRSVRQLMRGRDWQFRVSGWQATLQQARAQDFAYCDPPYLGRHADYYNAWTEQDAAALASALQELPCGFGLSTWQQNRYRSNPRLALDWNNWTVKTAPHFYHVGPTEALRHPMTEALVLGPTSAAGPP